MLHIVDDIENMTDDCYSVALLIKRSIEKDMTFEEKELERIGPYMDLVHTCLDFVKEI
jgi:phosphate:Na+ symporter